MQWYRVADVINQPFIRKVNAGGNTICLVGYEGKVFALAAKCPHAGADISQGWCSKGKIVCPFHRYSYDLHSGRGSEGQNDYINTYDVEVKKDGIYVGIKTFMEKLKEVFK